MMFNWKRILGVMGVIFVIIIVDIALRSALGWSIPGPILTLLFGVLIILLVCFPIYDFYLLKKRQGTLYPDLKQRVLEVARRNKGVVSRGEFGKMPPEWHGWFIKRLGMEGLAIPDPRDEDQILFPEIIADTRTEDEIMELGLPMEEGSKILKIKEDKSKKFEE